uniref:Alpha-L-arabinofuranosidase C-terminal domain-containing protein n=1 Tax=Arundo donax TaxID=35708 RepID=A0A0A9HJL4_ARUDO
MACYAPLFVHDNHPGWKWNPDAIVFNSWQQYGTPSYWMQTIFLESSGAMIHPVTITSSYSDSLAASAITWKDTENSFLRVKAGVNTMKSSVTVLAYSNVMDEISFSNPNNVVPVIRALPNAAEKMQVLLSPYSFTSFDLALDQYKRVAEM